MQYINQYFENIFFIIKATKNKNTQNRDINAEISKDIRKTMMIGMTLAVSITFSIRNRHYSIKNYIKNSALGACFGVLYSPYFLINKIDE